jgi:hypothetical protein
MKKLHDTKPGQVAGTTQDSKWKYFTIMSFLNAVMIPLPTLSNIPGAEQSVLESTRSLKDGIASANGSINDNDIDELSEGVSDERQAKTNLGTKET